MSIKISYMQMVARLRETPEDDVLRLVIADCVEEMGHADRAAFIRGCVRDLATPPVVADRLFRDGVISTTDVSTLLAAPTAGLTWEPSTADEGRFWLTDFDKSLGLMVEKGFICGVTLSSVWDATSVSNLRYYADHPLTRAHMPSAPADGIYILSSNAVIADFRFDVGTHNRMLVGRDFGSPGESIYVYDSVHVNALIAAMIDHRIFRIMRRMFNVNGSQTDNPHYVYFPCLRNQLTATQAIEKALLQFVIEGELR